MSRRTLNLDIYPAVLYACYHAKQWLHLRDQLGWADWLDDQPNAQGRVSSAVFEPDDGSPSTSPSTSRLTTTPPTPSPTRRSTPSPTSTTTSGRRCAATKPPPTSPGTSRDGFTATYPRARARARARRDVRLPHLRHHLHLTRSRKPLLPRLTMRVCLDCPTLLPDGRENRCPQHRRTRQQRGYDATHDRLRRAWVARQNAGETLTCWRCGQPITGPFDLGHDDHDRTMHRGPEHPACNRPTAARRGT